MGAVYLFLVLLLDVDDLLFQIVEDLGGPVHHLLGVEDDLARLGVSAGKVFENGFLALAEDLPQLAPELPHLDFLLSVLPVLQLFQVLHVGWLLELAPSLNPPVEEYLNVQVYLRLQLVQNYAQVGCLHLLAVRLAQLVVQKI